MVTFIQRHKFIKSKSAALAVVILFICLGLAALNTIWSVYIDSFVNNMSLVGLLSAAFTAIAVFWLFFSTPIIEKYPESKILFYCLLGLIVSYVIFFFTENFLVFIGAAVLMVLMDVLRIESFGILFRDVAKISEIGKAEGLQYTFANMGWLIGPLLAGYMASLLGIRPVFLISVIAVVIALVLFKTVRIRHHKPKREPKGALKTVFENTKSFLKNKNLRKMYLISGGLSAYWAIVYIYIPLFIIRAGLSHLWIGLFLSAIIIPLIAFEYPIGKLADKRGFKKFFVLGFGLLALFSISAFFIESIYAILLIFTLASIGAAFLEGTTEAYFFKTIKKSEEEKFYGPFKSSKYVFNAISKVVAAGVLFILPQNYIFIALAAEMLFFSVVAVFVKKI